MKPTSELSHNLEWAVWEYYIRALAELKNPLKAKEAVLRKCTIILQAEYPALPTDVPPIT